MREIRFRVWDDTNKTMFYPSYEITMSDDGSSSNFGKNIMQYTGLKDKNGKRIYEDDIIKGPGCGERDNTGLVSYDAPSFYVERHGRILPYIEWPSEFFRDCEVVGNKWQNPVLLEKEKSRD
jgi:hypothetical protein